MSEVPAHEIIICNSQAEIQNCYDIRVNVFHHEQKFPLETEFDELDSTATHFLLQLVPSRTPIGTIRGTAHNSSGDVYYKLSRLAVLKDYRQFKFGRELVEAFHAWVRTHATQAGIQNIKIITHSQIPVKGFYARFGYIPEGAEFDEDGDPHQRMVLRFVTPAN